MDGTERPASSILAATVYAIAAAVAVAVPVVYFALAGEPGALARTALVFAGTACACALGIAAVHLGPLRRVRRIEDELRFRAEHDVLTGLLNRSSLRKRVSEARARADRAGTSVAVMFLDLDDFKMVNDTAGHAAGDYLLSEVAVRLR